MAWCQSLPTQARTGQNSRIGASPSRPVRHLPSAARWFSLVSWRRQLDRHHGASPAMTRARLRHSPQIFPDRIYPQPSHPSPADPPPLSACARPGSAFRGRSVNRSARPASHARYGFPPPGVHPASCPTAASTPPTVRPARSPESTDRKAEPSATPAKIGTPTGDPDPKAPPECSRERWHTQGIRKHRKPRASCSRRSKPSFVWTLRATTTGR